MALTDIRITQHARFRVGEEQLVRAAVGERERQQAGDLVVLQLDHALAGRADLVAIEELRREEHRTDERREGPLFPVGRQHVVVDGAQIRDLCRGERAPVGGGGEPLEERVDALGGTERLAARGGRALGRGPGADDPRRLVELRRVAEVDARGLGDVGEAVFAGALGERHERRAGEEALHL